MKKAIVTGHSKGLGAALARQLADQGWEVLGVSRSLVNAGDEVCDLSHPHAVEEWLRSGRLESFLAGASRVLLINNASTVLPVAFAGRQVTDDIVRTVHLNVTAPLAITNAVVAARPEGARVQVVHISSGAARHAYAGWSVYCATKAALDLHAEALALEGVSVVSVAPGVVDTQMQAQVRASEDFPMRERFIGLHEKGQLTSPDEAAAKILALVESERFGDPVRRDVREL